MIILYRFLINILLILSPLVIIYRILKKKEDPERFLEKYGISNLNRKSGKLIWFHGSSVGEILSVIPLIQKLEKRKDIKHILLTSNTLSSSKVFKKYKLKKTSHQFFPIDSNIIIKKFLDFWKPYSAIFIESEIWPNTIIELKKRNTPIVLLNARITNKSYKNWKKIENFSSSLFKKINLCLSQNNETNLYLKKLGANKIKQIGNLKFSEPSLFDKNHLKPKVRNFFNKKKILFGAISTHPTEEIFCAKVHSQFKKYYKNILTIIIPRHIDRSLEIKKQIEINGLKVHLHNSKKAVHKNTDIYIVDTFGETKLFLNFCKIVFLGGSLIKHGGQNPLEAARVGCKVFYGPHINNFLEVYNLLNKYKISKKINKISDAKKIIATTIFKPNSSKKIIKKLKFIGNDVLSKNYKEVINYI